MAQQWFDTVLQEDPLNPEAMAARTRSMSGRDGDEFIAGIQKAVDTGVNKNWFSRMPRNIGVGLYKAALNTIETGVDIVDAVATSGEQSQAAVEGLPAPSPVASFPEFFESAHRFGNELTANNTLGDDITQGVAQFAIPFAAYTRALGGFQAGQTALNVARAAGAEMLTSVTALAPQEGRMADLLELGRQSEGKFGELLRSIAPDGSLANTYINWMTDRENEGKWEGRFKNAVDSLVASVAVGAVVKAGAIGIRAAKKIAAEPMKVGPAAQRGSVGVEPPVDELTDIERARALKNTVVEEGGEHVVLEGDALNQNAVVITLRPKE